MPAGLVAVRSAVEPRVLPQEQKDHRQLYDPVKRDGTASTGREKLLLQVRSQRSEYRWPQQYTDDQLTHHHRQSETATGLGQYPRDQQDDSNGRNNTTMSLRVRFIGAVPAFGNERSADCKACRKAGIQDRA